jgi:shikimate dehydrogenase
LEQAHALLRSVALHAPAFRNQPDHLAEYLTAAQQTHLDNHSEDPTISPVTHSLRIDRQHHPCGMAPDSTRSPWPAEVPFPDEAFVYDLVYKPAETLLVRAARSSGRQAANGQGMLIEQAALSFERWTGIHPSIDTMRQEISGLLRESLNEGSL